MRTRCLDYPQPPRVTYSYDKSIGQQELLVYIPGEAIKASPLTEPCPPLRPPPRGGDGKRRAAERCGWRSGWAGKIGKRETISIRHRGYRILMLKNHAVVRLVRALSSALERAAILLNA